MSRNSGTMNLDRTNDPGYIWNALYSKTTRLYIQKEGSAMKLNAKIFESMSKSWEEMCEEVSQFASTIKADRLFNISVTAAGGADVGGRGALGTIIVWYWD